MPLQWGRVCQAQRVLETPFRAGTVSLQTAPPPKAGLGNRLLFLPRTGGIKPKKGIVGVFTKEGRPAVLLAGRAGGRAATAQPTGLGAHSPACPGLPLSAQGPDPAQRCCRSWCCARVPAGKELPASCALCAAGVGRQWGMRPARPSIDSPHSFSACTNLNKVLIGEKRSDTPAFPQSSSMFHLPPIPHPLASTFHPPPSILHLPPSILHLLPSTFHPPFSTLHPSLSLLLPQAH